MPEVSLEDRIRTLEHDMAEIAHYLAYALTKRDHPAWRSAETVSEIEARYRLLENPNWPKAPNA